MLTQFTEFITHFIDCGFSRTAKNIGETTLLRKYIANVHAEGKKKF